MPERNPYEPPQSEINPTSKAIRRASSVASVFSHWIMPNLIGLQILTGVSCFAFDFMQAMAHSNYQQLQATAQFFAVSFLCLGLLLLLIALIRGSIALLIVEIAALLIFVWLTLPAIH